MDEIAITGISCRIAKCNNLEEFKDALLQGQDLVTHGHKRWNCDFLNTPNSLGIMGNLDKFDAGFFGVNPRQADHLDPRTRHLIELSVECIVDAGLNPQDLRGSNTGVYVAVAENSNKGYMDRALAIIANSISYYLDLKGPSYALDAGCSASGYALNQAVEALMFGSCNQALVCGAQCHLQPFDSIEFAKLGVLSKVGKCRTFDDDRDGFVKSEGIICILLQRKTDAKRIYATIAGIGCNVDGYKSEGILNPSSESQLNLLKQIYSRFHINSDEVEYIDAHGTGTLVGDIKECSALAQFFSTKTRISPLKIGSVKTNVGHCESAAALVSLMKLLVTINTGIILAHIHYETPALDIAPIENGLLEVCRKKTTYSGGLLALSSFGIGGTNSHVVIRPFLNQFLLENVSLKLDNKRLVLVSSRTEHGVEYWLKKAEDNKRNLAFLTLLDNIVHGSHINNYYYRGFTILNTTIKSISKCTTYRPIWFTYSGMGSQWTQMAKDLLILDVFRKSIEHCSGILKRFDLDLLNIITNEDEQIFSDPEKCFPAIISMSVALTDVLFAFGIKPDGIIGHSLGEIGCAYADGVISAEEAVLIAHARGLSTKQAILIPGLMASVGLALEECEQIIPKDVFVACHNSARNLTISGPQKSVRGFVQYLNEKGIFGKMVNTVGVAFHSKYIENAGELFLEKLKDIIPDPRKRSKKWLPSAIIETEYDSFLGKFHSAEYQHHNFMNRVHFKQVLDKVPENAVLIEIAPRGLFQAIFAKALSKNVTNIPISNEDALDNLEFLLTAIGKIYLSTNIYLNLQDINCQSSLPVDARTPFISPLVEWDHSASWAFHKYIPERNEGREFVLNLRSPDYKFLWGHIINGKPIFPTGGILFLVWSAFAYKNQIKLDQCPVIFKTTQILKTVILEDSLDFFVNIFLSEQFEVVYKQQLVATGTIAKLTSPVQQIPKENFSNNLIDKQDIFLEFHLRGADYNIPFNNIENLDISVTSGNIKWTQNWIVFMESVLQCVLFENHGVTPISILEVKIDPVEHRKCTCEGTLLSYIYNKSSGVATSGGFQIRNMTSTVPICSRKSEEKPTLYSLKFIPNNVKYEGQLTNHLEFSLDIILQIVHENNTRNNKTRVVELSQSQGNMKDLIFSLIHMKFLRHYTYSSIKNFNEVEPNTDLLILPLDQVVPSKNVLDVVGNPVFIFCKMDDRAFHQLIDNVVFKCSEGDVSYVLLKKCLKTPKKFTIIESSNNNFMWIEKVKENLSKSDCTVYLVSKTLTTGLLGFLNCLNAEKQAGNLRVFILNNSVDFYPTSDFYINQIEKDLTVNIYNNDKWCTYRMLPMKKLKYRKNVLNYHMSIRCEQIEMIESDLSYANKNLAIKYAAFSHWDAKLWKQDGIDVNNERNYALEFAGTSGNGKSLMGISFKGCLRTAIEPKLFWSLPDDLNMSLEEVCTIPLDYSIAYFAINYQTQLKEHDCVLISGTDTTCLAAIFFAMERSSSIIIDTETPAQISMVKDFFSDQSNLNFVCSVNENFTEHIMRLTKNKGISIIFTSSEENINQLYANVLADVGGKLITLYHNKSKIDAGILNQFTLKQCQIYRINIKTLLEQDDNVLGLIKSTLQIYLKKNALKPFPYCSRKATEIDGIIKYLNSDPNEKMIIQVDRFNDEFVKRKLYFDSKKSYIVVGGLGGIGLELTKWLIKNGATKIVLNSKTKNFNNYTKYLIESWTSQGVLIIVNDFPSHIIEGATKLLKSASDFAPIGGIFNLAMNITNNFFINLTPDDFLHVISPKLHICQNLNQLSQKMCPQLDHFVVFSAMAVLGNQTVSNFGYANSAIEMMCEERKSKGLPALAVQWGWIGDVGFTTKGILKKNQIDNMQSIFSCLKTLGQLILQENAVVSSAVYQSGVTHDVGDDQRGGILSNIASILGAKSERDIDNNVALVNLGVDSISSLEIKNLLINNLGVDLPTSEIRKLTLEDIKNLQKENSAQSK